MDGITEKEAVYGGDEYKNRNGDEYTCNDCGETFTLGDGDVCTKCGSDNWIFTPGNAKAKEGSA